jgi:hypothetical protein
MGLIGLLIVGFFSIVFLAHRYEFIHQFYRYDLPIYWPVLSIFYGFYQSLVSFIPSILFYIFLLGILIFMGSTLIFPEGLKKLAKNVEDTPHKADIFNFLLILVFLFFFIFMLRPGGFEYRWFFALLPAIFAFTAKGLIKIGGLAKSLFKVKYISLLVIVLLLGLGVYTEYHHADMIIKNKLTSYSEVRNSGLWLKDHSTKGDLIISASSMQHPYYSDKRVYNLDNFGDESNMTAFIETNHPRYLVLSIFQQHPDWAYTWPEKHNDTAFPVMAYYDPQNPQQPVLVIYELRYPVLIS